MSQQHVFYKRTYPVAVETRREQIYTLREHAHTASYTTIKVQKTAIKLVRYRQLKSQVKICRHFSGDTQNVFINNTKFEILIMESQKYVK
jgi:hypothetical protein